MKKVFIFLWQGPVAIPMAFALGILSVFIYSHYEITKPIPKKACTTANQECELAKDWSAVKIISLADTTGLDVFGYTLVVSNWYLFSSKTNALFPIATRYVSVDPAVAPSGINIGPTEMDEAKSYQGFFDETVVKLDSAQIDIVSGQRIIRADVLVLCLGNGELMAASGPLKAYFHPYKDD